MNRIALSFILIATLFSSGCVAVHPVVSALSITAGVLLDTEAEKPDGKISINKMLAQARSSKAVSISEDAQQLSLLVANDLLDATQKDRVIDYANRLSTKNVRNVHILTGSAGGLKEAFTSFQRGREVAQIIKSKGITTRVAMDPKRAPGRIVIVPKATTLPKATTRRNDA